MPNSTGETRTGRHPDAVFEHAGLLSQKGGFSPIYSLQSRSPLDKELLTRLQGLAEALHQFALEHVTYYPQFGLTEAGMAAARVVDSAEGVRWYIETILGKEEC